MNALEIASNNANSSDRHVSNLQKARKRSEDTALYFIAGHALLHVQVLMRLQLTQQ
jgi:predicted nucleic acid-binding Zn ribbon protein